MPPEIPLTDLATARAEMLPRALARREVRFLVEQHIVARLHVLLAQGNYRVEEWVRRYSREPSLGGLASLLVRVRLWSERELDPVEELRLDPDRFSLFVWSRFWTLPQLEAVLNDAIPKTRPSLVVENLDCEPATAAVRAATSLDTDHAGWEAPEKLLRGLHAEMRSAAMLAPEHQLVQHVLRRVGAAVRRLADFEEAYERATALDPLPDWVNAALDAVDSSGLDHHAMNAATKLVRRVSCRLWCTGTYKVPEAPLRPVQPKEDVPPPKVAERPAPQSQLEEAEIGF
jgi:hypothetical protein